MSLKKYIVGGWVRDKLLTQLGHPMQSNDRDWVVTEATPEEMLRLKFVPVGNDFPVFLHPKTHEEYALARTERQSGHGSMRWRWRKTGALSILTAVLKT